jgi:hypothetical protein
MANLKRHFQAPHAHTQDSTQQLRMRRTSSPHSGTTSLVASGRCARHGDGFRCWRSTAERTPSGKKELVGERYALGGESTSPSILSFLRSTPRTRLEVFTNASRRARHVFVLLYTQDSTRKRRTCLTSSPNRVPLSPFLFKCPHPTRSHMPPSLFGRPRPTRILASGRRARHGNGFCCWGLMTERMPTIHTRR